MKKKSYINLILIVVLVTMIATFTGCFYNEESYENESLNEEDDEDSDVSYWEDYEQLSIEDIVQFHILMIKTNTALP